MKQNVWAEHMFGCLFFVEVPFENGIFSGAIDGLKSGSHQFSALVKWKFQASEKEKQKTALLQETKWNSSLVGGWTNPFWKILYSQKWVHLLPPWKFQKQWETTTYCWWKESETTTLDV